MEYKAIRTPFEVDLEQGEFTGYASVFGVLDDGDFFGMRDIVHNGAFLKTIDERFDRILTTYGHDVGSHVMPIGRPLELEEHPRDRLPSQITDKFPESTGGLFTRNKISSTRAGIDVLNLLKDGVLREMSFGYDPMDFDFSDDGEVRHLRQIRLWEVAAVPWGMNPAAAIVGVKSVIPHVAAPLAGKEIAWTPALAESTDPDILMVVSAWHAEKDVLEPADFRFAHHTIEGETVLEGVQIAMADLLRGAPLPEDQKRAVFGHLAAHYAEFELEAPPYRDYKALKYSDAEILAICGAPMSGMDQTLIGDAMFELAKRRALLIAGKCNDGLACAVNQKINAKADEGLTRGQVIEAMHKLAKGQESVIDAVVAGKVQRIEGSVKEALEEVLELDGDDIDDLAAQDLDAERTVLEGRREELTEALTQVEDELEDLVEPVMVELLDARVAALQLEADVIEIEASLDLAA